MAHRSRLVLATVLLGVAVAAGAVASSLATAARTKKPAGRARPAAASPQRYPPVPSMTISFPEPGPGVLIPLGVLGVWRIIVRSRGMNA